MCKDAKTFLTNQFDAWFDMEMVKVPNEYEKIKCSENVK